MSCRKVQIFCMEIVANMATFPLLFDFLENWYTIFPFIHICMPRISQINLVIELEFFISPILASLEGLGFKIYSFF